MADLWERLKAARERIPEPEPVEAATSGSAPPGWTWAAPLVAERRLVFDIDPRFWLAVNPGPAVREWDGGLCFDTETTGLSGGAGTVAFLVGWAVLLPGSAPRVEIRQWFLRDHPGESDLIAALDGALREARALVSFNGASFDLPLLRSRWALAGREFPALPHRDDLHPSRRLWKRLLDSCRLSRLEETVLGIRRQDDVSGALVPSLWFDYLRQGALPDFAAPLEGVLRHHAQDVYSLLCLDLVLASVAADPDSGRWQPMLGRFPQRHAIARPAPGGLLHPDLAKATPVDFWGLLALKEDPSARSSLEETWEAGDDEAVGLAWADRLKRQGNRRAVEIWAKLWDSKRSYPALEEWLKWLEHRDRTPDSRRQARELIEEALTAPFLPQAWREGLQKRRDRLSRASGAS